MLSSVLLNFSGVQQGTPLIEQGVSIARRAAARVRGLTVIDTRRLASLLSTCEAAVFSCAELNRLDRVQAEYNGVRSQLSQACLAAGIDFDVRRVRGDPFDVLPSESRFHDLVVTSVAPPRDSCDKERSLSPAELISLLLQGVQPLLVLRGALPTAPRILLASDGGSAAARAVRQFLHQDLFPQAEFRLLAIGQTESQARNTLHDMADYCRGRGLHFESGWICGPPRRVLVPYANKWGAHVLVTGVQRGDRVFRWLIGDTAEQILRTTELALYATA
jgi:nucleotide-binding universal stress UspA family protein